MSRLVLQAGHLGKEQGKAYSIQKQPKRNLPFMILSLIAGSKGNVLTVCRHGRLHETSCFFSAAGRRRYGAGHLRTAHDHVRRKSPDQLLN